MSESERAPEETPERVVTTETVFRKRPQSELAALVRDILAGKVFLSTEIRSMSDLNHVFLPLAFGGLSFDKPPPEEPVAPTEDDPDRETKLAAFAVASSLFDAEFRVWDEARIAWREIAAQEIGVIYAYRENALPRGINGYPMFMEANILHWEDWKRVCKAVNRERDREIEV